MDLRNSANKIIDGIEINILLSKWFPHQHTILGVAIYMINFIQGKFRI